MAGTAHGRIDCRQITGITNIQMANTIFVSLYKGMKAIEAAGVADEVSNNFGTGSGFNYFDEANPCGTSGFGLFRMPSNSKRPYSLYILIQYMNTDALGLTWNAKINGYDVGGNGSVGVTFAAALDADGEDASPCAPGWGGDRDGADEKPSPVWAAPAGGKLWVGNRSNAPGGTFAATGIDLHKIIQPPWDTPTTRFGVVADDDSILFYLDTGDAGDPNIVAAALIDAYQDFAASCPFRHGVVRFAPAQSAGQIFDVAAGTGSTAGKSTVEVCVPFTASGDSKIGGMALGWGKKSAMQPSSLSSKYSDGPIEVFAIDGPHFGLAGTFDRFLGHVSNLACYNTLETTAARKRIVLGNKTLADAKLTIPWDGVTTPQDMAHGRDGVDF